jgi:hypothetical protein
MRISGLIAKAVAVAVVATSMSIPATAPVQAVPPGYLEHIAECAGWLLRDPATHAENCLPSNVPPSFGSITGGSGPGTPQCYDLSWKERKKTVCIKHNELKFPRKKHRKHHGKGSFPSMQVE